MEVCHMANTVPNLMILSLLAPLAPSVKKALCSCIAGHSRVSFQLVKRWAMDYVLPVCGGDDDDI